MTDATPRTALVLRHDPTIGLGHLEPVLVERGYRVVHVDPATDAAAAHGPLEPDLVVVLGGVMGAYETDAHPFLVDEIAFLRTRLAAGRPTLGVCLGAQLMAAALGSDVHPAGAVDVGYRELSLTPDGAASPVRHVTGVPVLEWHGDTFPLPAGATLLATSEACATEAFAAGDDVLAVQFHPEVTVDMHERWMSDDDGTLDELGLDRAAMRADRERFTPAMRTAAEAMTAEWLDGVERRAEARLTAAVLADPAGPGAMPVGETTAEDEAR